MIGKGIKWRDFHIKATDLPSSCPSSAALSSTPKYLHSRNHLYLIGSREMPAGFIALYSLRMDHAVQLAHLRVAHQSTRTCLLFVR